MEDSVNIPLTKNLRGIFVKQGYFSVNKMSQIIRKYLKHKIINDAEIINNYEKEHQQLYNVINLTINNGESQSVLIMGPRGSGKTIMVNTVLNELDANINLQSNTILIKLNGLIHTDDKLALKSCTIQMNLENAVGGKVFSTFAENLAYLLECLHSTGQRTTVKCLLFIIDEFDLFCFHDNQTLLYNLLDMTNYSQIPICVIGITSRLDVVELFEKRVKSRFSHRVINIFPFETTIDNRLKHVKQLLTISGKNTSHQFVKNWNKSILKLIKDPKFISGMQKLYDITKCERIFKNIMILFISNINETQTELKSEQFLELIDNLETGTKTRVLNSLSILELCLIIAMKHHIEIYDNQPFNFEMILERFNKFTIEYNKGLMAPRFVVLKAFEHIKNLELIAPVSSSNHRHLSEYEMYNLSVYPRQLEELIHGSGPLPTELRQWYDSKLV